MKITDIKLVDLMKSPLNEAVLMIEINKIKTLRYFLSINEYNAFKRMNKTQIFLLCIDMVKRSNYNVINQKEFYDKLKNQSEISREKFSGSNQKGEKI